MLTVADVIAYLAPEVGHPKKGVVVLAIGDVSAQEFSFDEVVAVQVVRDLERKEGANAHRQRPDFFIPDVEVEVRVAVSLPPQDAVSRMLGRVLRLGGAEGGAQLHAAEDEVDAEPVLPLHAP